LTGQCILRQGRTHKKATVRSIKRPKTSFLKKRTDRGLATGDFSDLELSTILV
jgi:hypothetical protein